VGGESERLGDSERGRGRKSERERERERERGGGGGREGERERDRAREIEREKRKRESQRESQRERKREGVYMMAQSLIICLLSGEPLPTLVFIIDAGLQRTAAYITVSLTCECVCVRERDPRER
jgi:hypothetical protein